MIDRRSEEIGALGVSVNLKKPTIHISGKVATPLQLELSTHSYRQLLDTIDNIGGSKETAPIPPPAGMQSSSVGSPASQSPSTLSPRWGLTLTNAVHYKSFKLVRNANIEENSVTEFQVLLPALRSTLRNNKISCWLLSTVCSCWCVCISTSVLTAKDCKVEWEVWLMLPLLLHSLQQEMRVNVCFIFFLN